MIEENGYHYPFLLSSLFEQRLLVEIPVVNQSGATLD
jgi:hypothetical protein